MLSIDENATVEEAGSSLLSFILEPKNWVALEGLNAAPPLKPGEHASYQRRVGALRICAAVEVSTQLKVTLRIAFRGAGLTPMKAADHLESFLAKRVPLLPNTEWQVQVDGKRWIHFYRTYSASPLRA